MTRKEIQVRKNIYRLGIATLFLLSALFIHEHLCPNAAAGPLGKSRIVAAYSIGNGHYFVLDNGDIYYALNPDSGGDGLFRKDGNFYAAIRE